MTRMWMVEPSVLCRQHLLGEHKELHQLVGAIRKGRWNVIEGHANLGQVETRSIIERHDELVLEMTRRGMNHKSPLPPFEASDFGEVDVLDSLLDLTDRCKRCRARYSISVVDKETADDYSNAEDSRT